jgi:hypothetical protein
MATKRYPKRGPSLLSDYHGYAWAILQYEVIVEADGVCQGCFMRPAVVANHKTYRFGIICPPEHLEPLCALCHGFYHRKLSQDPRTIRLTLKEEMLNKLQPKGGRLWLPEKPDPKNFHF